ncbi:MAG: hypothetical protein KDA68_17105, partial [Planctomycetaceae bacterium]|nr:hypothetical protein [Planctomycetaceae bacterium]
PLSDLPLQGLSPSSPTPKTSSRKCENLLHILIRLDPWPRTESRNSPPSPRSSLSLNGRH